MRLYACIVRAYVCVCVCVRVCILNTFHALLTVCILQIYEHTDYKMNFMQSEKMESITVIRSYP